MFVACVQVILHLPSWLPDYFPAASPDRHPSRVAGCPSEAKGMPHALRWPGLIGENQASVITMRRQTRILDNPSGKGKRYS